MDYVGKYKLDARPDRIDLRDREYRPPLRGLEKRYPSDKEIELFFQLYVKHAMVLNQGTEGACTGFGLAAMINYLLWKQELVKDGVEAMVPPAKVSMRMLYHLARFYDEWPGEDYEGSSCRGAVKAWHRHGVCADALWPYQDNNGKMKFIEPSPEWAENAAQRPLGVYYRVEKDALSDMQAAIQEVGAIYVSANVHSGWNLPQVNKAAGHGGLPMISWEKGQGKTGGHAFAIVGYNERGFVVQNSWGEKWGQHGFGLLGYDDWVENGTDAWVCVMGVPKETRSPSHFIPSKSTVRDGSLIMGYWQMPSMSFFPPPRHHYRDTALEPWRESEAYKHTVVMENEGRVLNRLVTKNTARDSVDYLAFDGPSEFFKREAAGRKPRLVVYAHGGLNSEYASIKRIKVMGPYFKENGIYPLFFTWRTGVGESLMGILEDSVTKVFDRAEGVEDLLESMRRRASEVIDRTLESGIANFGGKALWSQMKQNGAEAAKKGALDRGAFLTTLALKKLVNEFQDLEIHFIGHSAGAVILGSMLGDFPRNNLSLKTISLFAPACTLDFANRHFLRAMDHDVFEPEDLYLDILTDDREREDSIGPYGKSLLYLVSRALEECHKTPLLGLAKALNPVHNNSGSWSAKTQSQLKKWQKLGYWDSKNLSLLSREKVVTTREWNGSEYNNLDYISSTHGSFDNDVDIIDKTLRRILGGEDLQHRVENLRY